MKQISRMSKLLVNSIRSMANINHRLELFSEISYLKNQTLVSEDSLIDTCKSSIGEVVVSLTTYNKRIHDVYLTIESIGRQTIKANRVILWLDEEEFSDESLPLLIKRQINRGLEVKYCKNLLSYKKIIPTLSAYPDSNIITIDDDIIYPIDMIEVMLKDSKRNPDTVIANRVHEIRFHNNKVLPYKQWNYDVRTEDSSLSYMATGCGGVLYPKHCFHHQVSNADLFLKLAPNADDLWLKVMSVKKGIKTKKVTGHRQYNSRFFELPYSQDIALSLRNFTRTNDGNLNDKQFLRLIEHFNMKAENFF